MQTQPPETFSNGIEDHQAGKAVVNDPNLIIWKVLSTVNRMEMEFGWIYLFGWHTHNTIQIFGGNYKIERKNGWKALCEICLWRKIINIQSRKIDSIVEKHKRIFNDIFCEWLWDSLQCLYSLSMCPCLASTTQWMGPRYQHTTMCLEQIISHYNLSSTHASVFLIIVSPHSQLYIISTKLSLKKHILIFIKIIWLKSLYGICIDYGFR